MTNNLDDKQIKSKIQKAISITKDLEEPYRSKAFEIILSNLLDEKIENSSNGVNPDLPISAVVTTAKETSLESLIEIFADKCKITSEQLRNIYHFESNKPICIIPSRGNDADNQVSISRFLLAAYEEVYGVEWMSLRQDLSEHGLKNLGNLGRNLDKHPELFRRKGLQRGTEYKLVDTAKLETFNLIKELATSSNTPLTKPS